LKLRKADTHFKKEKMGAVRLKKGAKEFGGKGENSKKNFLRGQGKKNG